MGSSGIFYAKKWTTFLNKIHITSQDAKRVYYAAPNPVPNIEKVQNFVVGTDFEAYAEELEFFFVVSGVTESKEKKAVLLTNLPTEKYKLAKDLVVPILLREDFLTYDTNVERLQKQLKPQKYALVARYEFDNPARNAREKRWVSIFCFKASNYELYV